ncbi:MAG: hypothetical protein KGJ02_02530 [Verrucomicrobiota bacterium]|nr:hypothetical protein [Verrucomicrobiota bacterium]
MCMLAYLFFAATAVNPLLLQEEVQEEVNQDQLALEEQAIKSLEETQDEVAFEFEDEFDGEE